MSTPTSTITLYYAPYLIPDKNFMVDGLATYLSEIPATEKKVITDFQYIKHSLELEIKIDIYQSFLEYESSNTNWNYCSIQNTNGKVVYYFIIGKEWKGQDSVKLSLYMDTINTFKRGSDYILSNKSKILRLHKDRFERKVNKSQTTIISLVELSLDHGDIVYRDRISYGYDNGGYYCKVAFSITGLGGDISSYSDDLKYWEVIFEDNNVLDYGTQTWIVQLDKFEVNHADNIIILYIFIPYYPVDIAGFVYSYVKFNFELRHNEFTEEPLMIRKVDYFSEGLTPVLYKKNEYELHQNSNYDLDRGIETSWNLVYKGSGSVDCYCVPDIPILSYHETNNANADIEVNYSDLETEMYYLIQYGYNAPELPPQNHMEVVEFLSNIIIRADNEDYTPTHQATLGWKIRRGYAFIRKTGENFLRLYAVKQEQNQFTGQWQSEIQLVTTNLSGFKIVNALRCNYYKVADIPNTYTDSNGYWTNTDSSLTSAFMNSINQIDRTDSTLIKIIKCPYSPTPYEYSDSDGLYYNNPWQYDATYKGYKLIDTGAEFQNQIITQDNTEFSDLFINIVEFVTLNNFIKQDKNIKWESKLYHSDFYHRQFVYDSFSFVFKNEMIDTDKMYDVYSQNIEIINAPYYKYVFFFDFKVTNTINSKFLFSFPTYQLKLSQEDYDNVLPIARNNEVVIYNSDYLDYLRTSYNYDLKAKERTEKLAGLEFGVKTGVGLIGATAMTIASGGLAGAVAFGGVFASTLTGITQLTNTIAQAEESVERKLTQLKAKSLSVAGSDDVDLLQAYSNNKAKICVYQASDRLRDMLFNLFYYTGYTTSEMRKPDDNDFNSRLYFNFIQADIVFEKPATSSDFIPDVLLQNIRERYASGITILHAVEVETPVIYSYYYNWEQDKENWEISLLDNLGIDPIY